MVKIEERATARWMRIQGELNRFLAAELGCSVDEIAASNTFKGLFPLEDANFPLEKRQLDSAKVGKTIDGLAQAIRYLKKALVALDNLPYPENDEAKKELRLVTLRTYSAAVSGMIKSQGQERWEKSNLNKFDNSVEHLIDSLTRWKSSLENMPREDKNERAYSTAKRLLAIYEHFTGKKAAAGKDHYGKPTGDFSRMLEKVYSIIEIDFGFYEAARVAVNSRDIDPFIQALRRELERDFPINQ